MSNANLTSRTLIAILGITVLAYAAWHAGRLGLADWSSMRSRHEVMAWAEKRQVPSFERWARAVDELRSALRLTPEDPSLHEHLGVAYDLASTALVAPGIPNVYVEFALVHFRRAAELSPTSPYAWISVAAIMYRLGRVNEELYRAYALAMRYGPWEPAVQLAASKLGFELWERLDPALRHEVRQNWQRTANRQAEQLARIAIAQHREKLLCAEPIASVRKPLKCDK